MSTNTTMLTATDPSTGNVIREQPVATNADVEQILAASADAYREWRTTTFAERAAVLQQVAVRMRDDVERLALLMTEEMGKPIREARAEVEKSAWCAEHYATQGEAYLHTDQLASDATDSYVQYLPLGPLLGILPWNAPFWLAFRFMAPALMAGNTCVQKHDPHVPGCAAEIAELFVDCGAPAGIVQNLPLETARVKAVIQDPRIQAVSFTGSEQGGAAVAAAAAAEIKHSVLELGGSDPCLVFADADLERAADVITLSRMINAGQSCIAAKRIIVETPVYEEMSVLLAARFAALTVGDPRLETTDVGPIARSDLRDNLHRQVSRSIDAGARCLLGGELPTGDGWYYPVTLLADVHADMPASCEETFGPVGVLQKAADADEALRMANDTPYGLAASIWTDTARGAALARHLDTGQVAVNGIVKTDPRLPSGGVKRSGFGRELGPHGIREFVNAQQVWIGPAR